MAKSGALLLSLLVCLLYWHSARAEQKALLLSPALKMALSAGLGIPLYIENSEAKAKAADAKGKDAKSAAALDQVGELNLVAKGNDVYIQSVVLADQLDYRLTDELQQTLRAIDQLPATAEKIELANGAQLTLNLKTMRASVTVNQQAFAQVEQGDNYLAPSKAGFGGLVNYTANAYKSDGTDLEGYLSFNSLTGYNEHHVFLDGSVSSDVEDGGRIELDRALYEHDFRGRLLSFGRVSGWGLQSFADVSTLDGQDFYGASYGNYSQAVADKSAVSLIPIPIYLSSTGEARVFRNGRLIDIQRFPMGSHMLDTSRLPGGIYNISVRIAIGGDITSSRTYRVNKPNSRSDATGGGVSWQVWGGYTTYGDEFSGVGSGLDIEQPGELPGGLPGDLVTTPVAGQGNDIYDDDGVGGVSLSGSLSDLQWGGSLYQKGGTSVLESNLSYPLLDKLSLDVVSLFATDGSKELSTSLNYKMPFGSLWLNTEDSNLGDDLDQDLSTSYSVGGSLILDAFIAGAGNLNFSYEKDFDSGSFADQYTSRYSRVDYTQELFSNEYGTLQLSAGIDFSETNGTEERDKYMALTFSLPLEDTATVGYSNDKDGESLDLEYEKSLEGAIETVGFSTSTALDKAQDDSSNYNAYADYDSKYSIGSLSLQGDKESLSTSLNSAGSAAWGADGISASGEQGDSGVVIELPEEAVAGDSELVAKINGTTYPLNSDKTLIPLEPYARYQVEVLNANTAKGSYRVSANRSEFTLYPGNVIPIPVNVKRMVTIFGRLFGEGGKPLADTRVLNHVGKTTTDAQGYFSIDVSTHNPDVVVRLAEDRRVEIPVPINKDSESALWLGNLVCTQNTMACEWHDDESQP